MNDKNEKKYITVSYDLYTDNSEGIHEKIESAPEEYPFQFITGMGTTLDAFEKKIAELAQGDTFDFRLSIEDAYGEYEEDYVKELDKSLFEVNGHFDKESIYPGNVIGLANADGNHFDGLILEITDDKVVVDLNHPLADHELHFIGKVVTSRPATETEIDSAIKRLMGQEECECGCGGHDEDGLAGHEHHHDHGHSGCCCKGSGHHYDDEHQHGGHGGCGCGHKH